MVKHIGENTAVVSIKELGTNCWLPRRFISGRRCCRVFQCKYPEMKACEAVKTELAYLCEHSKQLIAEIEQKTKEQIQQLEDELGK